MSPITQHGSPKRAIVSLPPTPSVFRIQERLQELTLGVSHFQWLLLRNHPELYEDTPELVLRRKQRLWIEIRTWLFCFIPCLKYVARCRIARRDLPVVTETKDQLHLLSSPRA